MANEGLQFEHAAMYSALSKIDSPNTEQSRDLADAKAQYDKITNNNIKKKAEEVVEDMAPTGASQRQNYYKSFEKMSGGIEPKTDIKFKSGSTTYRCSMKWGNSFQLTSAGVDKSISVLQVVLEEVARKYSSNTDVKTLGYLQLLLEQIANQFENATGTMDQATAKRVMSTAKKAGGINEQLQSILGTKKNPQGGEVYDSFKYELTKECMTGALQFKGNTDMIATHLFTEDGVEPINDKMIRQVMKKAGVRMSLKGRGKDKITGIRKNAISIRYEV